MEKYIYELEMKVRDYECDLQGIVNNANYQHYLEHTRHEFLLSTGVSFAGLHEQGVDPVVARINLSLIHILILYGHETAGKNNIFQLFAVLECIGVDIRYVRREVEAF